ncbi:MAG TPA: rhodanese-like domain-containing protein [Spirochaetia bacterium]|nr:MAG: hypothetical protein A2Y41_10635 [Spirochaetes bacterium GWB1_36_13]HCL55787.1 rhodanese-like domain-containing protein [Spirochaetia bacterium]
MKKISLLSLLLTLLLLSCSGTGNNAEKNLKTLSAEDFKIELEKMSGDPQTVLLDIRTLPEYKSGALQNAELLDFYSDTFAQQLNALDKNKTYFIYCRSGNRSGQTMKMMEKAGFKRVYELGGGINSWLAKGYNTITVNKVTR